MCAECARAAAEDTEAKAKSKAKANEPLIYDTNFGIVNILKYFRKEPMGAFEKIALDDEILRKLKTVVKSWMSYHLDVGKLKSEEFFIL